VTQGTYHKFTISDDAENLRRMLLATGERELVEASPSDRIWGVGFAERDAQRNRHRWGQNLLGRALMDVRTRGGEEARLMNGSLRMCIVSEFLWTHAETEKCHLPSE
jgi:predicted NAD-dependent protein-ADP-ribosyltransferase YbiA (DUF1768 family)